MATPEASDYDFLERAQDDLRLRLMGDELLADWGVYAQRDGEIEWDLQRGSMLWAGRDGSDKVGAALVVGMPRVRLEDVQVADPPLEARFPIAIAEAPEMNRGVPGGTGVSSYAAMQRVVQVVNCFQTPGLSGGFYVASEGDIDAALPFELFGGRDDPGWRCIGYTVTAVAAIPTANVERCAKPEVSIADGVATITAADGDAVRYTTDESYPADPLHNPSSTVYGGPFAVAPGAPVRAVAFREGCIESDAAMAVAPAAEPEPLRDIEGDQMRDIEGEGMLGLP